MSKPPKETLIEKERFELGSKSGGGILSYEAWGYRESGRTIITRYNLAYINHTLFAGDNGRVLGFDNAHNYHHRHFMGQVEAVPFENYEATVARFRQELLVIIKGKTS